MTDAALTRERVLEMTAGREMDKLVAVHLFGHTVCNQAEAVRLSNAMLDQREPVVVNGISVPLIAFDGWYAQRFYLADTLTGTGMASLPHYSTDMAAAWMVVERLKSLGKIAGHPCDLCIKAGLGDSAFCEIFDLSPMGYAGYSGPMTSVDVDAPTVSEAICKAALIAVLGL